MEARVEVPITGKDVQVVAKARRQVFTAEYKRRIVKAADGWARAERACLDLGGAVTRLAQVVCALLFLGDGMRSSFLHGCRPGS